MDDSGRPSGLQRGEASIVSDEINDFSIDQFGISPETGFIPATPSLKILPDYFAQWENLMDNLPELIREKKIRNEVEHLSELEFSSTTLHSENEWERAYVVLCFIGQAYIWLHGQEGLVDVLPKKLAVPWCEVSRYLFLKPVISYAATAPYNYSLTDPLQPVSVDNIHANNTFTGTEDESWFYVSALAIELLAAPSLRAMEKVFKSMAIRDDATIRQCLDEVQSSLCKMTVELNKLYGRCDPLTFYLGIRPFQAGSKGLDAFPEGIVYEGVSEIPKQLHGASAGQAPSIHALDLFLGASHSGSDNQFLETMRLYMPKPHRMFLERLKRMPSVREYCALSRNLGLIQSYNKAVQEFVKFRSAHIILVTRYIVNQQAHSVNPTLDTKGSGGTEFMTFLKTVRNDTSKLCISESILSN